MSLTLADCSEVLSERTTHLCAAKMLLMWLFGGSKGMTKRIAQCHPSADGTLSSNGREGVCCLVEVAVSKMLTLVGCRMLRRYFLLLHLSV